MAPLPPRASPTVEAILVAYEAEAGDGWREHLGASMIGRECDRALWYEFRWITRAAQSGRMLRLFETGRLEEERLIRNLRRIGVTVLDVDPDSGRQPHGGHFGGSSSSPLPTIRRPSTRTSGRRSRRPISWPRPCRRSTRPCSAPSSIRRRRLYRRS